ncbi:MAG: 30S ribosomal protein S6 [Deltaproteobacteria bacterium]|nr:30S ribosomal protein S6 [Deltaproteobacteria bacterium]
MEYSYESVLVFVGDLDENAVKAQIDKINAVVTNHGGELTRSDVWGRRQLSFRIKKRTSGIYAMLQFTGDKALVADLDRQLRINENVLRHMIVARDKFAPDLAPGAHPDESFSFATGDEPAEGFDGAPGISGPAV